MAEAYFNLKANKFGFVRSDHPTTHYTVSAGTWYRITHHVPDNAESVFYYFYAGFPAFPEARKHSKLIGSAFYLQAKTGSTGRYENLLTASFCEADFNASNITYNNRPYSTSPQASKELNKNFAASNISLSRIGAENTAWFLSKYAGEVRLWYPVVCFSSEEDDSDGDYPVISMQSVRTDGTTPLHLRVFYDDAATVKSKVHITYGLYPVDTVESKASAAFGWELIKANAAEFCLDERWTQASAVFYWRKGSSGSYNAVNISGSTEQVTIAANTFPTGSTIQWYVKVTDTEGTTSQTAVDYFHTYATQITPTSYPSGTSVDNRVAQVFAWDYVSAGGATGYAQQSGSATLKWRKEGTTAWNDIAVTGTYKSISIAAYRFPANSTIEWYVTGKDASGVSSSSEIKTFSTQSYTLTVTTAPSGGNVGTQSAIPFAWTLANTAGAVTQTSASLFWRVQNTGNYTEIRNATATKSMSVPANTFPTGSTIQWYLSVTAKDGTVTSTNPATFTTVTPRMTLVTYPSGNNVDFGTAMRWTWTLTGPDGNYPQQSAALYWRTDTSQPWSSIPVSGNTKALSAPAYTFPSNSTVSWYLTATDIGGTVLTSSTMSFKTVAPKITPTDSPTSGYADPRDPITFSWFFSTGSAQYPQQSADFYWRVAGASAWNHVAASGATQSVTIPADTFPLQSDIEWYITGTDIGGTYSESTVYTFSTTASTAYAYCLAPVGRAEDGTKPIVFQWTVRNEDGSAATRTILAWKLPTESASEWHTLLDTTDPVLSYTAAADTFPAGPIEWRVIAYNRDSAEGPANLATFVVIRAPEPPEGLSATPVPITEISWQSTGQEAYEISIDGKVVEKAFGPGVYRWTAREPLSDGVHTVSVRIQGGYGLWSNPAETQAVITNIPKGSLTLNGDFRVDADLFWSLEYSGQETPETVAVYRDGAWIGTATGRESFRDRMVLGEHVYRVEYWYADGYYTRSDPVTGEMHASTVMIAEQRGGEWLPLRLSDSQVREQKFQRSRTSTLQHVTGAVYPVLELSTYDDLIGTYECAMRNHDEGVKLERLLGRRVIIKSRGDAVVIGGLTDLDKTVSTFYTVYRFSVRQSHWEDFVNDDANS